MTTTAEVPADFPFEPHFAEVRGSRMHYVDVGEGDPVIFLHGNPTSSYLWRNIIPHLSDQARCIAPDLIGMGLSDHPDIPYRYDDHYVYLEDFIAQLDLQRPVTLVLHDWGSGLGFRWAHEHQDQVRALVFMESMVRPMEWSDFPGMLAYIFRALRAPGTSYLMSRVANLFVKKMLPDMVARGLTPEAMKHYESAFPSIASRKPVEQWPKEIPVAGSPSDNRDTFQAYSNWLTSTGLPKLLFFADPGAILNAADVQWCRDNMSHLDTVDVGSGLHFIQEDHPDLIGRELARWYSGLE